MQGQAVPTPGSAPSSHCVLRDVGTSMCRELAAFCLASFRGWEEEGREKGDNLVCRRKNKEKWKMQSAWQRPKVREHRGREKNVCLLPKWMEIRCHGGAGKGRKGGKAQTGPRSRWSYPWGLLPLAPRASHHRVNQVGFDAVGS